MEVETVELFTNPLTHGHMKMEMLPRVLPRGLVNQFEKLSQHLPGPLRRKGLIQIGARFAQADDAGQKSDAGPPF